MKKKILQLTSRDLYIINVTEFMTAAKMPDNTNKEIYKKTLALLNSVIKAEHHPYFFHYIYCIKNDIEPKEKNDDYTLLLYYKEKIKSFEIKFGFGNIRILKKIDALARAHNMKIPSGEMQVLNHTIAKKICDELIFDVYLDSIIDELTKLKSLVPNFYKLVFEIDKMGNV